MIVGVFAGQQAAGHGTVVELKIAQSGWVQSLVGAGQLGVLVLVIVGQYGFAEVVIVVT